MPKQAANQAAVLEPEVQKFNILAVQGAQENGLGDNVEGEWTTSLPDGSLYGRTKQYDLFVFLKSNRPIDPKNLAKKVKQNLKKDLLAEYPITVRDRGDGIWEILDGQHRWKMAEINQRYLYFRVSTTMQEEDVPEINDSQSRWTAGDYLHHWASKGEPEYIKLQGFLARHPWMTVAVAKDMCSYGDRSKMGFAEGEFVANDVEFADMVAKAIKQWEGVITFWDESTFIYGISMCFEHEGFEHKRLLHKGRMNPMQVVKCVDVEQYMALFDKLYNYQTREDNRLHLEKLNAASRRRRADRRFRNNRQAEAALTFVSASAAALEAADDVGEDAE